VRQIKREKRAEAVLWRAAQQQRQLQQRPHLPLRSRAVLGEVGSSSANQKTAAAAHQGSGPAAGGGSHRGGGSSSCDVVIPVASPRTMARQLETVKQRDLAELLNIDAQIAALVERGATCPVLEEQTGAAAAAAAAPDQAPQKRRASRLADRLRQ
jgi:hypothetical protein